MDVATPEAQVEALRADRMAGKVDERTFFARMDELGPKLGQAAPPGAPATADQAQREVAQLLERRSTGKVGDVEFHAEMSRLGEKAHPPADPFEAMRDEIMAPAAPHEYQFAQEPGVELTGDALAWDTQLRAAFADAGLPKHLGRALHQSADLLLHKLGDAPPAVRDAHLSTFRDQMANLWGDAYVERSAAVVDFVADVAKKHPAIADLVDEMPWVLADATVANALWTHVEHQQRKARR